MKVECKGIQAEEISYKINRIRINPDDRVDMRPQFSREVRKVNNNPALNFVALSVKIETTEAEPKPFDIHVTLVGVYEIEVANQMEERDFVIKATQDLYPYLRATVTNLTASAYMPPVNLPIINGPIFPEDRDSYAFVDGANGIN